MRLALSAFLLLLLAFTTLAGNGCKRLPDGAAGSPASFAKMAFVPQFAQFSQGPHAAETAPAAQVASLTTADPATAPSRPVAVFCHPHAELHDQASLSAAEAQVALDIQANNDDRTEMIAADFDRAHVPALPHPTVAAAQHADATAWLALPLRPPRFSTPTA